MYMRGIAGEKYAADRKPIDVTRVYFVRREPADIRYVETLELGVLFDLLLDLFVEDVALVLFERLGERADNSKAVITNHREERQQRITHEKDLQGVVAELP